MIFRLNNKRFFINLINQFYLFLFSGHHPASDVAGSLRSGARYSLGLDSAVLHRVFLRYRYVTRYASLMQKTIRHRSLLTAGVKGLLILLFFVFAPSLTGQENQVSIPRIDLMPNEPTPMNIRDWRQVALQYDQFVFDGSKTGDYLPLSYINESGVNYPERKNFGLHTYVGTFTPLGNEAINVLPTLVGSTLVGLDKSNQDSENYILMSQDFFNRNNGELIYLNNLSGASGNDWWYDLMPNVFFYQLYDLYPGVGGAAEEQFISVADRFAESVRAMGGDDTPWSKAFMDYRAWNFREMIPNPDGVRQPEAAGAYAWVLYHAYGQTGNKEYLKAAEWSMEFLSDWPSNPSYELQLPYGTYTAARMNAMLGTTYDVEKLLNWSFDRGALRGWGTIVGRWGGFDVSGLVGEANDQGNDYAFQLNGIQQAAALLPMVRYDKRFARAIGKWVLNLSNATRLFYPGFLPSFLQDASDWSNEYDPQRVIGYEALRERWQGNSPFSTGDALRGNWAATNLALYGSSSIGYLGAMLEPTTDPKILQIDLLVTDFFKEESFPSYLYFNPYSSEKSITVNVGEQAVDIYDALSETFVQNGVAGEVLVTIPADEAIVLVWVPSGAEITTDRNKLLANGVVIDYQQSNTPFTWSPRIQALATENQNVECGDSARIYLTYFDQDQDVSEVTWSANGGVLAGEDDEKTWTAPDESGEYEIKVIVKDNAGNQDSAILMVNAVAEINRAPIIDEIVVDQNFIAPGNSLLLRCIANDPNDDNLSFSWSSDGGDFLNEDAANTEWLAPAETGIYTLSCMVDDGRGLSTSSSIKILVKELEGVSNASLIANYPLAGNALDISGNDLHGNIMGAFPTTDQLGRAGQAYRFNGSSHHISVPVQPVLNVQDGISVVCIFKALNLPEKEVFLLSHGSWQNRWKLSITPDRLLRWTINSSGGPIRDLDSSTPLEENKYYHCVATYDGQNMALYVDGVLQTFVEMSGPIRISQIPLLMGQMLPGEQEFNFNGVLDEVRIYDEAIFPSEVTDLYDASLVSNIPSSELPVLGFKIFPNPANERITINLENPISDQIDIFITDLNGKVFKKEIMNPGETDLNISLDALPNGTYMIRLESIGTSLSSEVFIKS